MDSGIRNYLRDHRRALIHRVIITLVALFTSLTIGSSIIGRWLASLTLDQLVRVGASINEDQIVLVDITEEDYERIFHHKRPLNPAKIIELVAAAHTAGAKVIAVDISTTDWPADWQKPTSQIPPHASVVWARGFYANPRSSESKPDYLLERLLGGAPGASDECYGVPALGEDAGVVRWFFTSMRAGGQPNPSFANQILYRSANLSCMPESKIEDRHLILDFTSIIHKEPASTLLEESKQADFGKKPEYDGKIVIIGGSFHAGTDMSETPIGTLSGLEINGQAVSALLHGNTRKEVGQVGSFLIDFGIGVVLVGFGMFGRRISLIATVSALLALSLILYRQYYMFLSFLPIVVGIIVHFRLERRQVPPSQLIIVQQTQPKLPTHEPCVIDVEDTHGSDHSKPESPTSRTTSST